MRDIEHQYQVAVIKWVDLQVKVYPDLEWLFAVPNGGHRSKAVAGKLKAEGVRKGVLDLWLPVPKSGFTGLIIEMKTETGAVSTDQKRWINGMRAHGWRVEVCRSPEDAIYALRDYLRPKTTSGGGE